MASANPFDLLGDDDNDDPSQLIAAAAALAQQQKVVTKKLPAPASAKSSSSIPAKLPAKPLPPAQAVRELKNEVMGGRGGGRSGGRGVGRGGGRGGGQNRDFGNNGNAYSNGFSGGYSAGEDGEVRSSERGSGGYGGPRPPFRGGRRGGYGDGDTGDSDRPRRQFERRSGTGRGSEIKREGAGRGNWGTPTEESFTQENEELLITEDKTLVLEKQSDQEDAPPLEANKENPVNEVEEKEPEDKEMTLEEYEKILEEKRKALLALKTEERKVNLDQELESMQQLSLKKGNDDVFIKLGSDKDSARRKENADRDERVKKSVSINEFLKPTEGERYYSPRGRGRGRGRGDQGGFRGGFAGGNANVLAAPAIEDPGQFPTLGGK